jgi:hypothetical protein
MLIVDVILEEVACNSHELPQLALQLELISRARRSTSPLALLLRLVLRRLRAPLDLEHLGISLALVLRLHLLNLLVAAGLNSGNATTHHIVF